MRIGYDAKRIFHNKTGLGNYGRDIVRILNKESTVAEFFLFNTKKSKLESRVSLKKSTIVYPNNLLWKTFPSLWRLIGQWQQIKSRKVNLYHGLSGEIPIQIKKNIIPKIVTIHDLIFLTHPHYYNFLDRIIYRLKFKYAVKRSDKIVAISEQTKKDIVTYFKINPDKIKVIYQGCNQAFKESYSEKAKDKVLHKYNLEEGYILNVGTLQERKNALAVIKAVHGTKMHLVLVGSAKRYAKQLEHYIEEHQLKNQVTFIQNIAVEELAMLYQKAGVFCYPSICEGFGIPIIEALYSKIPVVVTKGGCFPEASGPGAIYIDPRSPQEIRAKLIWLAENPLERKKMVEAGFNYVQKFSDKEVAKNLMNLYTSLVK